MFGEVGRTTGVGGHGVGEKQLKEEEEEGFRRAGGKKKKKGKVSDRALPGRAVLTCMQNTFRTWGVLHPHPAPAPRGPRPAAINGGAQHIPETPCIHPPLVFLSFPLPPE